MALVDGRIVGGAAVATPALGAAYLRRNNPRITEAEVLAIVGAYWYIGPKVGIAADGAFAQACHETNYFKFGNQVRYEQHNPAGIGATNDGAAGLSFPDWASGVAVQFAHLLAWCNAPGGERSPRKALVDQVAKSKGYARTWRDLGGRWAVPGTGYGEAIERHWQGILSEGKNMVAGPRIAISAGHHNTDGGDAYEIRQTGEITNETYRQLKAAGFDVVSLTRDGPDADDLPGDGMEPMGLQAVARKILTLKPLPVLFIEIHTEGGGGTGVFGIYPDMQGDTDADVRDVLAPLMSRRIAARTGLGVRAAGWLDPRRGPGVMSERETGVGAAGSRLGVFYATASVKAAVTRMIIEVGAHDKEPDLSISKRPGFARLAAAGIVDAIREWTGYHNGVDTLGVDAGTKLPIEAAKPATDEAATLKRWAEALIPFEARGNLTREGVIDLRQFGGKPDEWLALYERVATHRLNGASYVMRLDDWDALRNSGKVTLY